MVGISDAHIRKALRDDRIDMVIPYHKSSINPTIAVMRGIDLYNDYTNYQNTMNPDGTKNGKFKFDFYADLAKTHDPKQTATNYINACREAGLRPKFDQFAEEENYYKLLADFRLYDNDGNYAPQEAVKARFPQEAKGDVYDFDKLMKNSLEEAQKTSDALTNDMQSLLTDIRKELKKMDATNSKKQMSDKDIADMSNDEVKNLLRSMSLPYELSDAEIKEGIGRLQGLQLLYIRKLKDVPFSKRYYTDEGKILNQISDMVNSYSYEQSKRNRKENTSRRAKYVATDKEKNSPSRLGQDGNTEYDRTKINNGLANMSDSLERITGLNFSWDMSRLSASTYLKFRDSDGNDIHEIRLADHINNEGHPYEYRINTTNRLWSSVKKEILDIVNSWTDNTTLLENRDTSTFEFSDKDTDTDSSTAQIEDARLLAKILKEADMRKTSINIERAKRIARHIADKFNMSLPREWANDVMNLFDGYINHKNFNNYTADLIMREALQTASKLDSNNATVIAQELINQFWNLCVYEATRNSNNNKIKDLKLKHRKARAELKEASNKRIQRIKEHAKEVKELNKRAAERRTYIEKITKVAKDLNKKLVTNSKDVHVPQVLKAPLTRFLSALNFSSRQYLNVDRYGNERINPGVRAGQMTQKDIKLSEAFAQVSQAVTDINTAILRDGELEGFFGELPRFYEGFETDLKVMQTKINAITTAVGDNEYILNKMSNEDLETLYDFIKVFRTTINNINKTFGMARKAEISTLANATIADAKALNNHKYLKAELIEKAKEWLSWDNATPYVAFKRMGDTALDMYMSVVNANSQMMFRLNEIKEYAKSVYDEKEYKEWTDHINKFDIASGTVTMTDAQLMSLYCLYNRPQAKQHLLGGGMQVDIIEKSKSHPKVVQVDNYTVSDSELNEMFKNLSDRQIEVAKALQTYMADTGATWGNDTSMKMYGIEAFGEKEYFPIESDKDLVEKDDSKINEESLFRLMNMSFSKALTKNANNAISIKSIFDVFTAHCSDMAKYSTLALPVYDMIRWLNYTAKVKGQGTQFITDSVVKALKGTFGNKSVTYIRQFIKDLNSSNATDELGLKGFNSFIKASKVASVGANLRVATLQFTALYRASIVLDPKYIMQGFTGKSEYLEAEAHSGIALSKHLGFRDTNVTRNMQRQIKQDETLAEKIAEISMLPAEWADRLTWGHLWKACKAQYEANNKNVQKGSDEYWNGVTALFDEMCLRTQVFDSVISKTQIMRRKAIFGNMVTTFMSEAQLSYNTMMDVVLEWSNNARRTGSVKNGIGKYGKKLGRTMIAYLTTNFAASVVEALWAYMRDRDPEEEQLPQLFDEWKTNFLLDLSISAKLPFVKDIVSVMQGYSIDRPDMQWISTAKNVWTSWSKIFGGEKDVTYKTVYNTLKAASQATGLPISNAVRDCVAIWNSSIGVAFPSLFIKQK